MDLYRGVLGRILQIVIARNIIAAKEDEFREGIQHKTSLDELYTGKALSRSDGVVKESEFVDLISILRGAVQTKHCSVFSFDKNSTRLQCVYTDHKKWIPVLQYGNGIVRKCVEENQTIQYHANAVPELDGNMFEKKFNSLSLPIHDMNGVVNGVLLVQIERNEPYWDNIDEEIANCIGRHIGSALQRAGCPDRYGSEENLLLDLIASLSKEIELASLLRVASEMISSIFCSKPCRIFLVNRKKSEYHLPLQNLCPNSLDEPIRHFPASIGIIGATLQSGDVLHIPDACTDPRYDAMADGRDEMFIHSILVLPVRNNSGEYIGALEIGCKTSEESFQKQEEDLVRGIAHCLGLSLWNALRFESAKLETRKSDALLATSQAKYNSNEHVSNVFTAFTNIACKFLSVQHATIFFVDELGHTLHSRIDSKWNAYSIPMGQYIQGKVALSGELEHVPYDAQLHPELDQSYDELAKIKCKSILCAPIKSRTVLSMKKKQARRAREKVLAVLYVVNKVGFTNGGYFDDGDIELIKALSFEMASVVHNKAWELMFQPELSTSDTDESVQVANAFLSQYTSAAYNVRRRSSFERRRSAGNNAELGNTLNVPNNSLGEQSLKTKYNKSSGFLSHYNVKALPCHDTLCHWGLDPWKHSSTELTDLVVNMFETFELRDHFEIPLLTLRRFVMNVKNQYQNVPYHNFYHAFSTLHTVFMMLYAQVKLTAKRVFTESAQNSTKDPLSPTNFRFEQIFAPKDVLAMFVAAYCHDMNHNGRNNEFHIRTSSRIALMYNDHSVLENMHAAACFETLRHPGQNVLATLDEKEYHLIRKSIINAILATDMQNHANMVASLHEKFKPGVFQPTDESHKELLINTIVHSADLSNPTLPYDLHIRWSFSLLQEFNMQYEEEVSLGLLPTSYMNAKPNSSDQGQVNLAFIDSCVFPLWSILNSALNGLEGCLQNIQENRQTWINQIASSSQ
uniref:Phosphodiesterase n=1 Tax=Albugo laibachii Nc14 TaxID=890382 RepID=F0WCD7_9STRA|nr:3'5'cyclic nucleotide phosphodiesterase putative [Albugo laibachii Nc14]|eukprot:CCA18852.1 3'5'cyclic nucleotide phosphodiesterase putative [Albugo laibachii Nc14]